MNVRMHLPPLHESQRRVRDDQHRFQVLACGRRWGKTRLGSARCIETAGHGGRAWWVAPSFPMSQVGWRLIAMLAKQVPATEIRLGDRMVVMPSGGTVQVRSADNPDSLRGEGLDFVVLDECAYMAEAAWAEALRPALSDRQGRAMFISTPHRRNWFWHSWQRGHGDDPEWRSFQFPTSDNPFILPAEIEAARGLLPDRLFRQEYLAEFIEDEGAVFRRIREAATAVVQREPIAGHEYAFGVDWAKSADFTVITVLDLTDYSVAALDRFNQIDYQVQLGRLRALYERFQPRVVVPERNSIGEPLIEQLQREGMRLKPFTTTSASKTVLIDALALAFEKGAIRILNNPTLIAELEAFEMERTPAGTLRYSAPQGMHDDCVMSLALAWSVAARPAPRPARSYQG